MKKLVTLVLLTLLSISAVPGDSYSPGGFPPDNKGQTDCLIDAVLQEDLNRVFDLVLFSDCSIHSTDSEGRSALHHAAMIGSSDTASLLLLHGADPGSADNHGYLPVHLAYPHSPETAGILSGYGRLLFTPGPDGGSPIDTAIESGWNALRRLVSLDSWYITSESGENLLHRAARLGSTDVLRHLLEQSLSVHQSDREHNRPLDSALLEPESPEHLEAAALLITSGSPLPRDHQYTYLYQALKPDGINRQDASGRSALYHAVEAGHAGIALFLLGRGADPRLADYEGTTPLHKAVRTHQISLISSLAAHGSMVNAPDINGRTPLHDALPGNPSVEIVSLLISLGANAQSADHEGTTALHSAGLHGDRQITQSLIEAGSLLSVKDREGFTPLRRALEAGNSESAAILLEQGAPLFSSMEAQLIIQKNISLISLLGELDRTGETDTQGNTLLHAAALLPGSSAAIRLLLEQGIPVDVQNAQGETPLCLAAGALNWDTVEQLLAHGADPFHRTPRGTSPMIDFLKADSGTIGRLFSGDLVNDSDPDGITPLMIAASEQLPDAVSLLLERGADTQAADVSGQSALHIAAEQDSVPVMQRLIREQEHTNIRNNTGYTPLHSAVNKGSHRASRLLLLAGSSPHSRSHEGFTPMHTALLKGDMYMIRTLREFSSSLESTDSQGRTPLLLASSLVLEDEALLLIELGADIHARDSLGSTPLHLAVQHRMERLIKQLIESGADIHSKNRSGLSPFLTALSQGPGIVELAAGGGRIRERDNEGNTPLHIAVRERSGPEIISMLISRGAEVNSRNNQLLTPLHYALEHPSRKAAALLTEAGADLFITNSDGAAPIDMLLAMPMEALSWPERQVLLTSRDHEGKTALHYAVIRDHKDAAAYLISLGADPRREDDFGNTPGSFTDREDLLELLR